MIEYFKSSIVKKLNIIILPVISFGIMFFAGIVVLIDYNHAIKNISENSKISLELAKLSLVEPIWNLNQEATEDICHAFS